MTFITQNWQFILGCVVAVGLMITLIILYKKNIVTEQYLSDLENYLDLIDDGEGIVPLLAQYARKAVYAVEQMVKAGVLQKTDEGRKNMATQIVVELAAADGVELDESSKTAVSSLIEAEVYQMHVQ